MISRLSQIFCLISGGFLPFSPVLHAQQPPILEWSQLHSRTCVTWSQRRKDCYGGSPVHDLSFHDFYVGVV